MNTHDNSDYKWTWTNFGNKEGFLVTYLNNGNSVFFPTTGYKSYLSQDSESSPGGFYWSSSYYTTIGISGMAHTLSFLSTYPPGVGDGACFQGHPIRPVCE